MENDQGNTVLDYGPPRPAAIPAKPSALGLRLATYGLAIIVGVIAVRIEWLNYAAGTIMPMSVAVGGKWRESPLASEEAWRRFRLPETDDPSRPLTPAEHSQMKAEVGASSASNSARNWVSTAGLLQYLLVPALLIHIVTLAAISGTGRSPVIFVLLIAVLLFSAGSLFYRGYFSSLLD